MALVVAVYALLVLPTLGRLGIGWDEQTDLGIATTYVSERGGWLVGSDVDPINVRLPMAATAVWFELTGGPDLVSARALACLLGALTLVAVMTFCRHEFDQRKALVAGLLLATSPYFLAFSRSAFSDGDAFVTCALAWLLASLASLRHDRTLGRGTLAAVLLGAAFASKISATAAIPVVAIALLWPAADERREDESVGRSAWTAILVLLGALYIAVFGGWEIGKRLADTRYEDVGLAYLAGHAFVVVTLFIATLVVAWRNRGAHLGPARLCSFVLVLGGLTFFVLPPLHTTNPDIVNQLIGAFLYSNVESPAAFALEAAALHFAVIAVKPSLAIGIAAWASIVIAVFRVRGRPELRLPLLLIAFYGLFLLRLPWAQTFYMLPAFPAFTILIADAGIELFDRRRRVAVAIAVVSVALLGADLVRSYPDYHLNGYQWLGTRIWGGRPTIGARSVVQIPTDGAEQALRFVAENAEPGATVITYVRPRHIIAATISRPDLRIRDGLGEAKALERADYVITTLNAEIDHGFGSNTPTAVMARPYDRERLERNFARVFTVVRAFDLEVAAVWKRLAAPRAGSARTPSGQEHPTPVPPEPQ